MNYRTLLFIATFFALAGCATNKDNKMKIVSQKNSIQTMALYDGDIPNAIKGKNLERIRDKNTSNTFILDVTHPNITAYRPDPAIANGTAVIILPGGGYSGVSIVKEGYQIAERFNSIGVTAFVVKYRMPMQKSMHNKAVGPLQDAQQAINLVRKNSAKWHIDPTKVGIMGFSAGGHLASSAAVHYDQAVSENLQEQNLRPDFQILIYPVISFTDGMTHKGSRQNLIGPNFSREQKIYFSSEKQVTADTPPAFIVHAGDDKVVPVENSLAYYQALHQHGVESQLSILPNGGHGFGMENPVDWFKQLTEWMKNRGLLDISNIQKH